MKRYKGSYTIEASFIMAVIAVAIVYIIALAFYVTDCQNARNISIIEGIRKQEEYHYYKGNTGYINVKKKLSDTIFNTSKIETGDYENLIEISMVCATLENLHCKKDVTGITMSTGLEFKEKTGIFEDITISEKITNRNEADFLRMLSALRKGKIK